MRQKPGTAKPTAESMVKDIRSRTRKHHSAEEKIRIVLEGLRGEDSIAELCRREGIATSLYYSWSKEFLEAGKKRLAGDTARQATGPEVKDLRQEVVQVELDDARERGELQEQRFAHARLAMPHDVQHVRDDLRQERHAAQA